MKDYYKVLGVPRNATVEQIRQSYRELIKKAHPDINRTSTAEDRAKELNEAWTVLSDAEAKMSYDMDIKLNDSRQGEAASASRAQTNQKPEPTYCCEKCGRIDATLRVSATWRVYSIIYYSRKSPTVKILCSKCRLKESLMASLVTMLLGWWSLYGFFWTIEALYKNAFGGVQPKENNVGLLNVLGYQLYQAGRLDEAYKALDASLKLKPDPRAEKMRDFLKQQLPPLQTYSFWQRLRKFDLHPIYYHAPALAAMFVIACFGMSTLDAQSTSPANTYHSRSSTQAHTFVTAQGDRPQFSEPEQSIPYQGLLESSTNFDNYSGTTAPFKIATRSSDGNYVMKIEDWTTGAFVASYFIRSGNTLQVELPLGSYKLKFAMGDKWYGTKYLFGPATSYSYIADKMDFYIEGNYAKGNEIQLIPQVGGNLATPAMSAAEW